MKSKWSGRFSKGSLFLIGGFLILFSPCAGKAQNNSAANLAGTVWNRTPQIIGFPSDGTFATITRGYTFGLQGKVKEALSVNKPAGVMLAYEYDYHNRENRLTTRPTMSINTFETFDGTYEINGRSIYLNFPGYTISASLDSDTMRGELIYKQNNKKEEWIVRRQPNPSAEPIDGGKFGPGRLSNDWKLEIR